MRQRNGFGESVIRWGGVGGLMAAITLLALAFVPRPFSGMNHVAILGGARLLDGGESARYLVYLKTNLTIDSLYLLGHVVMWFGYAEMLRRRGRGFSWMIAVLGVVSGALDFLENEIRWALAGSLGTELPGRAGWVIAWQTTVGMSFWAMLIVALMTAIMVWSERRVDRFMTLIGLASLIGAAFIYTRGYLLVFIWMIVWHGASAIYLWRTEGRENGVNTE